MSVCNTKKIALTPQKEQFQHAIFFVGAVVLFFISITMLDLDIVRMINRLERLPAILRLFMRIEPSIVFDGIIQLFISMMLAICALFLGGVIALILAFLAAENTAPSKWLALFIKAIVSTIRAIPNLVLILLLVAPLGLGYGAAIASLTLSSMGYLTRAFASTIEEQPPQIVETMRSTGASWIQIVVHGFVPHVMSSFIAWVSIRLELSVSDSITLGILGAGGIGTMLSHAIRRHNHAEVSTLILIIFITVLTIEVFLNRVKKKMNS